MPEVAEKPKVERSPAQIAATQRMADAQAAKRAEKAAGGPAMSEPVEAEGLKLAFLPVQVWAVVAPLMAKAEQNMSPGLTTPTIRDKDGRTWMVSMVYGPNPSVVVKKLGGSSKSLDWRNKIAFLERQDPGIELPMEPNEALLNPQGAKARLEKYTKERKEFEDGRKAELEELWGLVKADEATETISFSLKGRRLALVLEE